MRSIVDFPASGIFPCILSGNADRPDKKCKCPPKHTHVLRIHWRCPYICPNSWRPNSNPKWIFPPMVFSHVLYQEIQKSQMQKVSALLNIVMCSKNIGNVHFSVRIHGGITLTLRLCCDCV